ncbi:MAG TPA: T9SS type A sorting domain-containing protein [Flavipsychrobacter sp.]|nr:T9SS type A sorting domain-containing protein [Flavipsychrobacter sp.]
MYRTLSTLLILLLSSTALQVNGKSFSRCRAFVILENSNTIPTYPDRYDSTQYFYSNGRPGTYFFYKNYWVMKFDSSVTYENGPAWTIKKYTYQSFDSKNNTSQAIELQGAAKDSLTKTDYTYTSANDTSGIIVYNYKKKAWVPYVKTENTYDALRRVKTTTRYRWDEFKKVWNGENYKQLYNYNSSGSITDIVRQKWTSATASWSDFYKDTYVYNGMQLTEVYSQTWNGTIWIDNGKIRYNYNTSGLIDSTQYMSYSATTGWADNFKYKYTYNTASLCDTELMFQYSMTQAQIRIMYQYNAKDLRTELLQQEWTGNQWINRSKNNMTYDTLDNETSHVQNSWEGGIWQYSSGDYKVFLYHDLYNPDIEVSIPEQIATEQQKLSLFPIPTANSINVYTNWKEPQPFTISITNVEGKIIKQWNEEPCEVYKKTISLMGMPPGNYILRLTGKTSQAAKQFIIN